MKIEMLLNPLIHTYSIVEHFMFSLFIIVDIYTERERGNVFVIVSEMISVLKSIKSINGIGMIIFSRGL